MKKKTVRFYKTFANVAAGYSNYLVFYLVYEGWSNMSFGTCINCGELFVIDWENPKTEKLNIMQIAGSENCPKCNFKLKETLKNYPEFIKIPNGKLGSFVPETTIPPDSESLTIEVFELRP